MSRADRSDWFVGLALVAFLLLVAFVAVFLPCEYLGWVNVSDVPSRCLEGALKR